MTLGEMGEFGFIDRLRGLVGEGSASVGIGDDAAVLRTSADRCLVAATDMLVEGFHFRLATSSPADVGWKSVAVNVSDLAAMGAEPRWVLVALGAPGATSREVLDGLYSGIVEACGAYGAEVVGGDTVRSERLVLGVTALGELAGEPMLRSQAAVGDALAVTGPLGSSAAGLNLLLSQDPVRGAAYPADPRGVSPEDASVCMEVHRRPRARVAEGWALREAGVRCAIDLSDGLASDVYRLAEASGVGAEVDAGRVPVAAEARRVAEARGWDALQMAIGGGEDFELLVALPADRLEEVGVELLPVGRVVDEGVWLVGDGVREPLRGGYDHFTGGVGG